MYKSTKKAICLDGRTIIEKFYFYIRMRIRESGDYKKFFASQKFGKFTGGRQKHISIVIKKFNTFINFETLMLCVYFGVEKMNIDK